MKLGQWIYLAILLTIPLTARAVVINGELEGAQGEKLAADPAVPGGEESDYEGRFYYNTTSNVLRLYDGTAWKEVGPSGSVSNPLTADLDADTFDILDLGNIGIGTTAASELLHVAIGVGTIPTLATTNIALFQNNDDTTDTMSISLLSGNASTATINFGDTDDIDIGEIFYSHSIDAMAFRVNAANRMAIISTGDVGIGTTSPGHRLSVLESGVGTQVQATNATAGDTSGDGLRLGINDSLEANIINSENGPLRLFTNNVERVDIKSGGETEILVGLVANGLNVVHVGASCSGAGCSTVAARALKADSPVTSISRTATGIYVVNWDSAVFSSSTYSCSCTALDTDAITCTTRSYAAGSVEVRRSDWTNSDDEGDFRMVCMGDTAAY